MAGARHDGDRNSGAMAMRRRGILAAAGAVVAGIALARTAERVSADGTPVTTGNSFSYNNPIGLTGAVSSALFGIGPAAGLVGIGSGTASIGLDGVAGSGGVGVRGSNPVAAPTFPANVAVLGTNTNGGGVGVLGEIPSGSSGASTISVWGNNLSAGAGAIGVYGNAPQGIGVFGTTSAAGQFGVVGQALVDNAFGLAGIANTNGSAAFAGGTANPNAFAASFQGHVQVFEGAFDVAGMGNKHGLAQHPDGSWRTFYSVESPECWVEDFGEGTLTAGKAEITLDADFAALVHTDHYHVFLTEHDEHHALVVTQRTASGFTVVADSATAVAKGKSVARVSGTFSWRVVAKPKTEAKVERLAKARLAPKMDFSKLPKPPPAPPVAPPKKP